MNEGVGDDDEYKSLVFLDFYKGQVLWMSLTSRVVSFSSSGLHR